MDAHEMAQLSSTVNPCQPGTLPSNILQNLKNDKHCMPVKTRRGKQIINPPISSVVEDEVRKDYEVVEDNNEFLDKTVKEAEYTKRLSPFLDHHHHFHKD